MITPTLYVLIFAGVAALFGVCIWIFLVVPQERAIKDARRLPTEDRAGAGDDPLP